MRRIVCSGLSVVILLASVVAAASQPRDPFKAYPASDSWNGPPAPLKLTSAFAKSYAPLLAPASRRPANFAGRYRFEAWHARNGCFRGAAIDLKTGTVAFLPLDMCGSGRASPSHFVTFRRDSNLVSIAGQAGASSGAKTRWYAFDGSDFSDVAEAVAKSSIAVKRPDAPPAKPDALVAEKSPAPEAVKPPVAIDPPDAAPARPAAPVVEKGSAPEVVKPSTEFKPSDAQPAKPVASVVEKKPSPEVARPSVDIKSLGTMPAKPLASVMEKGPVPGLVRPSVDIKPLNIAPAKPVASVVEKASTPESAKSSTDTKPSKVKPAKPTASVAEKSPAPVIADTKAAVPSAVEKPKAAMEPAKAAKPAYTKPTPVVTAPARANAPKPAMPIGQTAAESGATAHRDDTSSPSKSASKPEEPQRGAETTGAIATLKAHIQAYLAMLPAATKRTFPPSTFVALGAIAAALAISLVFFARLRSLLKKLWWLLSLAVLGVLILACMLGTYVSVFVLVMRGFDDGTPPYLLAALVLPPIGYGLYRLLISTYDRGGDQQTPVPADETAKLLRLAKPRPSSGSSQSDSFLKEPASGSPEPVSPG